jgi:hypothetical protein
MPTKKRKPVETGKTKETSNRTLATGGVTGVSGRNPGDYSGMAAPRVGGTSPKSTPLSGGTKKQVKAAKSMVRSSPGSGASKAAKAAQKRIK